MCQSFKLTKWAVFPSKTIITDAQAVHTPAIITAVIGTSRDVAGLAGEVWEAHTFPIHAVPLVVAVVWTHRLAAVVPRVALMTHTLPVHTSSIVIALIGTRGHGAVWAFPSWVTETAAAVVLVRTMAATAGVHAWREKVRREIIQRQNFINCLIYSSRHAHFLLPPDSPPTTSGHATAYLQHHLHHSILEYIGSLSSWPLPPARWLCTRETGRFRTPHSYTSGSPAWCCVWRWCRSPHW